MKAGQRIACLAPNCDVHHHLHHRLLQRLQDFCCCGVSSRLNLHSSHISLYGALITVRKAFARCQQLQREDVAAQSVYASFRWSTCPLINVQYTNNIFLLFMAVIAFIESLFFIKSANSWQQVRVQTYFAWKLSSGARGTNCYKYWEINWDEEVNGSAPRNAIISQLSIPCTDVIPSAFEPHTSVSSGEYIIKPYCEQANREHFHAWNSHRRQSACFTTIPDYAVRSALSQQQLGFLITQ